MAVTTRTVLSLTPEAVTAVRDIRSQEPDAAELALAIGITGVDHMRFVYELTFIPLVDAAPDDVVQVFGDLPVVVRAGSVSRLEGSTITITEAGLTIDNPNGASPKIPSGGAPLEGPLAQRLQTLLDEQINPAIAGHGGYARLVSVEGDTAFLQLGGGCQGCGMAAVTLRQGIEVAIMESIPEIQHVIDVTDHESGQNPYFH
ncbi:MAG TPA: iron-sulfur cluster assembly accessory protein [Actinobacteria bacterium]|nr:iron-sulfur cluster assembly accessory protein [Actinomycetota bacterium]